MKKLLVLVIILHASCIIANGQYAYKIAKLKYNGGGDWYANKTSLPNLIKFANANLRMNIFPEEDIVEPGSHRYFWLSVCSHDRAWQRNLQRSRCAATCAGT